MKSHTMLTMLVVLLMCAGVSEAFVPSGFGAERLSFTRNRRQRPLANVVVLRASLRQQRGQGEIVNVEKKVNLLPCDDVVLPGERVDILTDEIDLIQDSIEKHFGAVALGVVVEAELEDEEYDEEEQELMLETASLCEIKGVEESKEEEGFYVVTLQGVGRLRVIDFIREEPFVTTKSKVMVENFGSNQTVNDMLADNIELFFSKITQMEERLELKQNRSPQESAAAFSLLDYYEACYETALKHDVTPYEFTLSPNKQRSLPELVAMSWAAFSCMEEGEDLDMASYRMRAFDWDNLTERLKLAQYMLREKELKVQGKLMRLEDEGSDRSMVAVGGAVFSEEDNAFQ